MARKQLIDADGGDYVGGERRFSAEYRKRRLPRSFAQRV